MMRMWIEGWLDLVGYDVTLEKMCFKNLSEWRSRIYRANVKQETVPDCWPVKEKDLSPKVFLFVVGTRRVKLPEDERSWRECVYLCSNCDRYLRPSSGREIQLRVAFHLQTIIRQSYWCWMLEIDYVTGYRAHTPGLTYTCEDRRSWKPFASTPPPPPTQFSR